jgi:hypothetical protein
MKEGNWAWHRRRAMFQFGSEKICMMHLMETVFEGGLIGFIFEGIA